MFVALSAETPLGHLFRQIWRKYARHSRSSCGSRLVAYLVAQRALEIAGLCHDSRQFRL